MDALTKHIIEQLARSERCTVFRPEIERVWPDLTEMIAKRNAAIHAFAKERGWAATIVDPGVVVTFRKAGTNHDGHDGSSDGVPTREQSDGRLDDFRRNGSER